MDTVLEFQQLSKDYRAGWRRRRVRALDGFSLSVREGEVFGFLGPNGAGKTTAIHLAMGFMRPSSGGGRMLGRPFGDSATRARVGFLAENSPMHNRSVLDLLEFYSKLNGCDSTRKRSMHALERVGLTGLNKLTAMKLSRGQQQRLGLAQAIVNDPDLLVLDEPTSALDPVARVAVRQLLLELKAAGKTIFLSSHQLFEIEAVCDRIGILRRGRLVRVGAVQELLENTDRSIVVARGIPLTAFKSSTAANGYVSFEVERSAQRKAIDCVWQLGGEVISVNPVRESLEAMFLRLALGDDDGEES
jgi:ABC-2 type transport system ATP-binding protein